MRNTFRSLAIASALLFSRESYSTDFQGSPGNYSKQIFTNDQGLVENRVYHNNHHFLSVFKDEHGALVVRARPDIGEDAWGASWYSHPYIAGAELRGSSFKVKTSKTRAIITANGPVSEGIDSTRGIWKLKMTFLDDRINMAVGGHGRMNIKLSSLENIPGDLNMGRATSNYLIDVPLLSGGIGDTGDSSGFSAQVNNQIGEAFKFNWNPRNGNDFPQNFGKSAGFALAPGFNEVDSIALGYTNVIAATTKPGLAVAYDIHSKLTNDVMACGFTYDGEKSKDPYADNVGAAVYIPKSKIPSKPLVVDVDFLSEAK